MKQLVIIPMLPIRMRYSVWWNAVFPMRMQELMRGVMHVVTPSFMGEAYESFNDTPSFCQKQVDWELDWLCYIHNLNLRPSDVVLVLDCTTPGLIGSYITTHKPCQFMGFCHGTSFNRMDIFARTRNTFDIAALRAYDRVLVASEYHRQKLLTQLHQYKEFADHRIINTHALPSMIRERGIEIPSLPSFTERRDICVVDRHSAQKRNMGLLLRVNNKLRAMNLSVQDRHGTCATWNEYLTMLSTYKFLLVTAQEETYGYQVHDAMSVGTIPIVPNDLAYPESVPQQFCYNRTSCDVDNDETSDAIVRRITALMDDKAVCADTYPIIPTNQPYINTFFANLVQEVFALSESGR